MSRMVKMSDFLKTVQASGIPRPRGHYSQGIVVPAGPLLFVAGHVGTDPRTEELAGPDIKSQTVQLIDNIAAVLATQEVEEEGHLMPAGLDRVVFSHVYLIDKDDFSGMNEVYAAKFGEHRPPRAAVTVSALPMGARIEMWCYASLAPRYR